MFKKFKPVAVVVPPRRVDVRPSAYSDGQHAYTTGQRSSKNPYRFGSNDYDMWSEGWRDAEFKDPSIKGDD